MRNGWSRVRLGELVKVQSGAGFPKKYQGKEEGRIPFYKVSDMNIAGNEVAMIRANNFISESERRELGASIFPAGSVIFPKIGGAIATNKKRITTTDCCVDNNVMGAVPKFDKIDSDFLFYFFLGHDLAEFANKAHLPSIKKTTVESWELEVPTSLPEQRRIVGILDEAFDGIATAQANAEKNLQNARALFESYLNAIFTRNGEDVTEMPLGNAVEEISTGPFGSLLHKSDYEHGGIPLVNPINIVGSKIVPDARKAIGETTAKRLARYELRANDIVIGRRGEIGRCAVVDAEQAGWLCGTGSFIIRPSNKTNPFYLSHLLRSGTYRQQLERVAGRATMPSISNRDLASLIIRLPSMERQRQVLSRLDKLSEETHHLEFIYQRKLVALNELKKSLLHQAFSGQL